VLAIAQNRHTDSEQVRPEVDSPFDKLVTGHSRASRGKRPRVTGY
jgi:hypothetical protein